MVAGEALSRESGRSCAPGWPRGRGHVLLHAETRTTAAHAGNCIRLEELQMELDDITGAVVKEAIRIHRRPGTGLLESVYERLLDRALQRRGLRVERQRAIAFSYDGLEF